MTPSDSGSPEEEQVQTQWTSLFYFTTRRHLAPLALACCCSLICGVLVPVLAALLGAVFNLLSSFGAQAISAAELMEGMSNQSLSLLALGVASLFVQAAHFGLWVTCGELQAKTAREDLFDALLRADLAWFETTQDGVAALLPRVQAHIRDLQQATSQSLGFTVQNLVTAIASLILGLYTSWKLALVCLVTVPICAVIMGVVSTKIQPTVEGQQAELTKAAKFASSAISLIVTVKHCNGEDAELRQYASTIRKAAQWYLKEALICALEIGSIHLLTFSMFVQGFWFGGYLVSRGELNAGQVLTTFWASFQATQAIENIMPVMMILEKGRVSASFLRATLINARSCRDVQDEQGTKCPLYCEGDIRFKNVTFAYPSRPDRHVLNDCSFFFPAGDLTFVVGKSGSGKSTLSNLLMRFYNSSSGEISIDGNLVGALDVNWIRNNVTLVQQNSTLFNETIMKNIAFGAREFETIAEDDILNCIRFAGLSDMLCGLSEGLDTVVGLQGNFLSGGQRQRVALARSRLRDTPVLILDESTSALDCPSRVAVMAALRSWRKGKTTVVITHDLSQIGENDFMYIVDQGKVVRKGYRQAVEREDIDLFRAYTPVNIPAALSIPKREYTTKKPRLSPSRTTPSSLFRRRISMCSPNRWSMLSSPIDGHMSIPKKPPGEMRSAIGRHELQRLPSVAEDKQIELTPVEAKEKDVYESEPKKFAPLSVLFGTVISSLGLRDRFLLALGFFSAFCHAASTPVFSYMFSKLLGTLFLEEDGSRSALKWALAVLGIAAANGVSSFGMHYLLEHCGQAWVDHLRREAMKRILRQSRHWFEKDTNNFSSIATCLNRNAEEMKNLIAKFAGFVVVAAVMIIMGLTWGLVVCWKLTSVGAACAPALYLLTRMFDSVSHKWESRCGRAQDIMAGIFAETFLDIQTVRALTLESYFHRKHNKANWQTLTIGLKRAFFTGSLFGLSDSSILFVYALVFYYGAVLATSLHSSTEQILTVFSMLLFSMVNVKAVLSLIPQISASRDNATRVLELAALPEISHEHRGRFPIVNPLPIRFTDVNFSYPSRPETLVLRNFNLSIQESTCTAIVGSSGSGKSTVASLILSLYPENATTPALGGFSGAILIGGIEMRRIHVPTLRGLITVIPQHSTLFPTTIRANISYGLEESSPLSTIESVRGAARAAGIDDFVSSLPLGYDTVVGDGGLGLSGGQVQRLAIARALVRKPRVLILDEATSNLDGESVALIGKTIKSLMAVARGKMTVIIITHAREMMEIADRVVVIDQGRVVDDGDCLN